MHRETQEVMGTVVSYAVVGDETAATAAVARAREWLICVDTIFSTYKPGSEISQIRQGSLTIEQANPLVTEVMEIAESAVADGAGAFTITPGGLFDPSGVVKGWAIEKASDILRAAALPDHLINGGGDVQASGVREPGHGWRVAIADPRESTRTVAVVGGRAPLAVATSGTSERGDHVERLDDDGMLSITVVGDHLTEVDIAATTAFALGHSAREWVEDHPDLAAFAVLDGGRMWTSTRMQPLLVG